LIWFIFNSINLTRHQRLYLHHLSNFLNHFDLLLSDHTQKFRPVWLKFLHKLLQSLYFTHLLFFNLSLASLLHHYSRMFSHIIEAHWFFPFRNFILLLLLLLLLFLLLLFVFILLILLELNWRLLWSHRFMICLFVVLDIL